MPREETRFQVLAFSGLSGPPVAGDDVVKVRAGTIIWDAVVVVENADGAGRTMDVEVVEGNSTNSLLNDMDTSPANVPALSAASKLAAAPAVPYYCGADAVVRVNPSANTNATFKFTVILTISSVLG